MFVGDYVSRVYLKAKGAQPHAEYQMFAIELEYINRLATIKITRDRLAQFQKTQKKI